MPNVVFYQYLNAYKILIFPTPKIEGGVTLSLSTINADTLKELLSLSNPRSAKGLNFIKVPHHPKEAYDDIAPVIKVDRKFYYDGKYFDKLPGARRWLFRELPRGEDVSAAYNEWKTVAPLLLSAGMPVDKYAIDNMAIINGWMNTITPEVDDYLPPLSPEVLFWVAESMHGGYRYSEEGFSGFAYEYDFKSYYADKMINREYPAGVPELKTLTSPDPNLLAIYRWSDGYYSGDRTINKKTRKLRSIAMDGEPNALVWPDRIHGSEIFGQYIGKIYPLKEAGHGIAKSYLNVLTGLIGKYNWTYKDVEDAYTRGVNVKGRERAISLDSIFKLPKYAHLYSFICLYGRQEMAQIHESFGKDFKYAHTDGFLSTVEVDLDECNQGLSPSSIGYLRLVGSGNYTVHSGRKKMSEGS